MKLLCPSDALAPNSSRGFEIDGCKVLAVRRDGVAYFFLDSSASLIQCATHGALFLIESGECIAGPCAGQSLKALPGREDAQGLWVQL